MDQTTAFGLLILIICIILIVRYKESIPSTKAVTLYTGINQTGNMVDFPFSSDPILFAEQTAEPGTCTKAKFKLKYRSAAFHFKGKIKIYSNKKHQMTLRVSPNQGWDDIDSFIRHQMTARDIQWPTDKSAPWCGSGVQYFMEMEMEK